VHTAEGGFGIDAAGNGSVAAGQESERLVRRQVKREQMIHELLFRAMPRGAGAIEAPGRGDGERIEHRDPGIDVLTEGLGHTIDMAGPDPAQTGVIVEANAVIGEPSRQSAVVEYRPHPDSAFTGCPQHLGDQIDSLTIPATLPWFEAGPVEGPTECA
jgi:hypothetical protein